jgi:hypothetical protein
MGISQSEEELRSHLKEQIEFLIRSSIAYDEGYYSEGKRLAAVIRILLHDTPSSTSLLTLLKKKDILFYDTALDYDPRNEMPTTALIMYHLGPKGFEYVPALDRRPRVTRVPFEIWWNKVVFKIDDYIAARKDLILTVCNKDGGAHVDPRLNEGYANLTRFNSIGWKVVRDETQEAIATPPELASIRQISHEVMKSLQDEFPEYV